MAFRESRGRTITKAITFRILVIIADMTVIYFITGSLKIAASVITITNITSTVMYVVHERAWNKVHWGKNKNHSGRKKD